MSEQRLQFTFHKCLGLGGFGEVYLATLVRPGGLSKRVAVKVLKPDLRNAEAAVQRLRDEGRMLAILDHPGILRVLEMTLIQGRVALVTEYLDGIDLARCCRPSTLLPQSVVLGALGEVASALHCAWTTPSPETGKPLQLIHRDVKPENIRIGRHGEVKLLDFGIARTTEMFRHAKTAQGDLPFTPGYAAPEAFTKGFQGSASDVYALGVSMYRLLAAERLYESMDLADQVAICCLHERYAPFLKQRLAKIETPDPVMDLLRDMLAYEASARPTAAEVEDRAAGIAGVLPGPSHVRWARATEFPEPAGLEGGSLTGQTLVEDGLHGSKRKKRGVSLKPRSHEAARGLLDQPDSTGAPRPQARQDLGNVADLTPPIAPLHEAPPPPPPPSKPSMPPAPPPVPPALQSSPPPSLAAPPPAPGLKTVRPHTGPFARPGARDLPPDTPSLNPVQATTDAPSNRDRTPHEAPSTMGDFAEEPERAPPSPDASFDGKATMDAWALEADSVLDEPPAPSLSDAKTVDRDPPPASAKPPPPRAPKPLTMAEIGGDAETRGGGGVSTLAILAIAVVVGGGLGGLALFAIAVGVLAMSAFG